VVIEHRIARLVQLGIRKSRYFGKKKTRWQVVMAALAANVSLVVSYLSGKLSQQIQAAQQVTTHDLLLTISTCWMRYFRSYAPARVL
jgi:negative regulator of sigma E activity